MDPNLDQKSKWSLIGYLKTKVEDQCTDVLTQDASKSRNGVVHPMLELLFYTTLTCTQTDAIMLKIENNANLSNLLKVELVETLKE